ncbi:sulfotransferase family 2 domain-containing protein [Paracoccus aurantiacus]|uniref:sulfotransferase family 2 domain-containing protein n=1 Tax=Paracoccus aurantiacus TaxID=2599412 RepID=UPI00164B68BD|nr:sulfotransferase family 2 domain-containing protein [Paracoccus aurantiacus]
MPIFRGQGKVIYFAHVPKCAGSSAEDYLRRFGCVAMLDRKYKAGRGRNWTQSSPQHMLAKDLERLFPADFFDAGFAIVRAPKARLRSAFHYHRDHEKRIPAGETFANFVQQIEGFDDRRHRSFDHHFLPQNAFVPDWCRVFRLEDGTAALEDWLAGLLDLPATAPFPQELRGSYKAAADDDQQTDDLIRRIYNADYERFGYS